MSIKEEPKVMIERAEPLTKEGIFAMGLSDKEYFIFCQGKKQGKQKIEEFKEMIDKKLEGFKKVRQGIIGNTKVLTAYNCFIAHLEELKSQVEKGK